MPREEFTPADTEIVAIVVTYQSEDVIGDCVFSLLDQSERNLRVIIVDNASDDRTVECITRITYERSLDLEIESATNIPHNRPLPNLLLIRAPQNRGFAAGCNLGLAAARHRSSAGLFWLLNPDCRADPHCAAAYLDAARKTPDFGLLGGRTLFSADSRVIQSDGGRVSPWTAVCRNINQGLSAEAAPTPDLAELNFLSGANLVASRQFLETVGPMAEDYFLYYEEVDWALKRDTLSLSVCPEARVYHHGGTSAGSGTLGRGPSAFSNYFNYRNRLRVALRHFPAALPGAYAYSVLKIGQLALKGAYSEAWGAFLGLHQLGPTRAIRQRLGPVATKVATGR